MLIHPTAVIHESAKIGNNVSIGPYAVVDTGAVIGDHTTLYPHTYIGSGVVLGTHCTLFPNSSVREKCILGNRVILQSGSIIGSCGFGYTTCMQTGKHTKIEQIGNVIIEDDVEIGANATIDRARFKTTYVKKSLYIRIKIFFRILHRVIYTSLSR